ncbi:MAG: hypothetical protein OEW35_06435 [Gammaproteobacteria bacterium]|nr:hypothetical protein [Gammaproteobacteria bacterium]MDH4256534.1 hypothetical protein [Gammaproteobacteria bacterium]MDH5309871.1 hypothetical protein [Gammaproteobacteria bacterium]
MKLRDIRDDRDFYQAVNEYTGMVWRWGAHVDDDAEIEPTPDELIGILEERIRWVKEHKRVVETYLRRRGGASWVRVIDGSGSGK